MKFIKRKNLLKKGAEKGIADASYFYGITILRKEIEFKVVLTAIFNNLSSKYF